MVQLVLLRVAKYGCYYVCNALQSANYHYLLWFGRCEERCALAVALNQV